MRVRNSIVHPRWVLKRHRNQKQYDHYCNLAQATNGDDSVTRERHWQHAEHYLRMMKGLAG